MKMLNVLSDFFKGNYFLATIVLLVVVGLVLYFYIRQANKKEGFLGFVYERLENVMGANQEIPEVPEVPLAEPQPEPEQDQGMLQVDDKMQQEQIAQIVSGGDQLKPEDLLPKYDEENQFAKENPVSKLLKEQNFLISGYHVGLNTVMQSNKIPYHDIRSMPPIPKENIGPWNQSSFEQSPAQMRRFFEIGA